MINSKDLIPLTKNLTLLFAEDHDELRVSTTEVLNNFFREVISVQDGEIALDEYKKREAQNRAFDIVITDIQMPKLDGIALIENIYKIKSNQKVIVLSAHDDSDYLVSLVNLGVAQFIKKPIDFQELLSALLNIAQKKSITSKKTSDKNIIYLDPHTYFQRDTLTLRQNNTSLYLTKYEMLFLNILTADRVKIVTTEEIVQKFQNLNESIDPQNIRKLISKLRKKLPKDTIESIYGVGYRVLSFE